MNKKLETVHLKSEMGQVNLDDCEIVCMDGTLLDASYLYGAIQTFRETFDEFPFLKKMGTWDDYLQDPNYYEDFRDGVSFSKKQVKLDYPIEQVDLFILDENPSVGTGYLVAFNHLLGRCDVIGTVEFLKYYTKGKRCTKSKTELLSLPDEQYQHILSLFYDSLEGYHYGRESYDSSIQYYLEDFFLFASEVFIETITCKIEKIGKMCTSLNQNNNSDVPMDLDIDIRSLSDKVLTPREFVERRRDFWENFVEDEREDEKLKDWRKYSTMSDLEKDYENCLMDFTRIGYSFLPKYKEHFLNERVCFSENRKQLSYPINHVELVVLHNTGTEVVYLQAGNQQLNQYEFIGRLVLERNYDGSYSMAKPKIVAFTSEQYSAILSSLHDSFKSCSYYARGRYDDTYGEKLAEILKFSASVFTCIYSNQLQVEKQEQKRIVKVLDNRMNI